MSAIKRIAAYRLLEQSVELEVAGVSDWGERRKIGEEAGIISKSTAFCRMRIRP